MTFTVHNDLAISYYTIFITSKISILHIILKVILYSVNIELACKMLKETCVCVCVITYHEVWQ